MLKKIEGIFVLASASVGSWVSYSYIHSTRKRPLHELVSPAADLLHPLVGEETALGRAPPGAQRPRDHLRHGVRPLQPR